MSRRGVAAFADLIGVQLAPWQRWILDEWDRTGRPPIPCPLAARRAERRQLAQLGELLAAAVDRADRHDDPTP